MAAAVNVLQSPSPSPPPPPRREKGSPFASHPTSSLENLRTEGNPHSPQPKQPAMRSPPSHSPNSSFHRKDKLPLPPSDLFPAEPWLDDAATLDANHLARTLVGARARASALTSSIGSIISHYASRWLPELATGRAAEPSSPHESPTAAWLKKRFFVETLIGVLPLERDAVPCDFLLRLLRMASMVGAAADRISELEARAGRQLDQATLREVMIPPFSHTCGALLDVGLMLRLLRWFVGAEEGPAVVARSGAAGLAKVAKLVDAYLAEAAGRRTGSGGVRGASPGGAGPRAGHRRWLVPGHRHVHQGMRIFYHSLVLAQALTSQFLFSLGRRCQVGREGDLEGRF